MLSEYKGATKHAFQGIIRSLKENGNSFVSSLTYKKYKKEIDSLISSKREYENGYILALKK